MNACLDKKGRLIADRGLEAALERECARREKKRLKKQDAIRRRENLRLGMPGDWICRASCKAYTRDFYAGLENFYAQIDHDLAQWEFERDLALGVKWAVEKARREERYQRSFRAILKNGLAKGGF